jgi:hypothetical protein
MRRIEFPKAHSYVVVFVGHVGQLDNSDELKNIGELDNTKVIVNGEILGNTVLVHCHDSLSISVESGRLVVFVYALNKA